MSTPRNDDQPRGINGHKPGEYAEHIPTPPTAPLPAPGLTDEQLDLLTETELRRLYANVTFDLGVAGCTIDRTEAAYRLLEEPGFYHLDVDRIDALRSAAGSDDKFIDQVVKTDAWKSLVDGAVPDNGYGDDAKVSGYITDTLLNAFEDIDENADDDAEIESSPSMAEETRMEALRGRLAKRLSIAGLTVDRSEVRRRLEDPRAYFSEDREPGLALVNKLVARFGSNDALIGRVLNTGVWSELDDMTNEHTDAVTQAMNDAIDELEAE